jgi:hypothetical protein
MRAESQGGIDMFGEYFYRKIGETLYRELEKQPLRAYYSQGSRVFQAEVLQVLDRESLEPTVILHLTSYEKTPSGLRDGNSNRDLGDHRIRITVEMQGLNDIWYRILHALGEADYASQIPK